MIKENLHTIYDKIAQLALKLEQLNRQNTSLAKEIEQRHAEIVILKKQQSDAVEHIKQQNVALIEENKQLKAVLADFKKKANTPLPEDLIRDNQLLVNENRELRANLVEMEEQQLSFLLSETQKTGAKRREQEEKEAKMSKREVEQYVKEIDKCIETLKER